MDSQAWAGSIRVRYPSVGLFIGVSTICSSFAYGLQMVTSCMQAVSGSCGLIAADICNASLFLLQTSRIGYVQTADLFLTCNAGFILLHN